jgi:dolichol-phosphate mannosyltransferase
VKPSSYKEPNQTGERDSQRVLVSLFVYNEGEKFLHLLSQFPAERYYDLLVVDDGSTDQVISPSESGDYTLVRNEVNMGLGASIKRAFEYALEHNYGVLVIMAGNGKDSPGEIPRLLAPIMAGDYDFVQGSRFLDGGHHSNMPAYRWAATQYVHPIMFSILAGAKVTESTNGFRALRTDILMDERINWRQSWLDQYEVEQYLHFKVIRLGYRRTEVPVSKTYPPAGHEYTKVKAFTGWWSMLKPAIYLALGIKH